MAKRKRDARKGSEVRSDEVEASDRLAQSDVPFETVARLGRASNPILAAIAHRAAAKRDDASLKHAYAGEHIGLLQAIERHAEPPLLARLLARSDDDWTRGWLFNAVSAGHPA